MDNDTRALRWRGRRALRNITSRERCFDCGRSTLNSGGGVAIRQDDEGRVGYAGLASCGSVWLCPVCNAKIMAKRAIDVGLALTWAHANGLLVIWGSLTQRHGVNDALSDLMGLEAKAWRRVTQSKMWKNENTVLTVPHEHVGGEHDRHGCPWDCKRQEDYVDTGRGGRVGYIRAAEITVGYHGWHPHFHPLMFWRGSRASAEDFAGRVVAKWVESVVKLGGDALAVGGQQLEVLDPESYTAALGEYMTKSTYALAYEATWSQGKNGEGRKGKKRAAGTVSHWSLLAGIEETGRTGEMIRAAELWLELEGATKSARMLTWSRGLRTFVGLTHQEQKDEEIAAEEVGTVDDTVCFITAEGWRSIRDDAEIASGILSVLEEGGWPALRQYLDLAGVEWFTINEGVPA